MVAQFAKRWTIEVTFEESRAHLGIETQRQWSNRSIERETPCLLGLYSVVALLTRAVSADAGIPLQATAWYAKTRATFADCLALLRRHLWSVKDFREPEADPRFAKILRSDLDRLTNAVCYAY